MNKLWVVPTPIGNLGDITLRALEMLRECDLILAEDTRKTGILLKHFDIQKPLRSHHKFNEKQSSESLVRLISEGKKVCLVSDAGTPGISDPGYALVQACLDADIEVETLPGATAFVPALVNSGLPNHQFVFVGFLPQKKGRQKALESLHNEARTMVFYESPFRVLKCLEQFIEHFGPDRRVAVSREISKIHEETVRGTLETVKHYFETHTVKGEFVIVLAGMDSSSNPTE